MIETTKFITDWEQPDLDLIGILVQKTWDNEQGANSWQVRSLIDGTLHNWENCNFVALPTKNLWNDVRAESKESFHLKGWDWHRSR